MYGVHQSAGILTAMPSKHYHHGNSLYLHIVKEVVIFTIRIRQSGLLGNILKLARLTLRRMLERLLTHINAVHGYP